MTSPNVLPNLGDGMLNEAKLKTKKGESTEKKRNRKKEQKDGVGKLVQITTQDNSLRTGKRKKGEKSPGKKKAKSMANNNALVGKSNEFDNETDDSFDEQNGRLKKVHKKEQDQNSKKGEKSLDKGEADQNEAFHASSADKECLKRKKGKSREAKKKKKEEHDSTKEVKSLEKEGGADQNEAFHASSADKECLKRKKGKSREAKKKKKEEERDSTKEVKSLEKEGGADADDVYLISSGDEDCSKGMKKWITGYHESRPGLTILQQRIDEFITSYEAQLDQERKEREARVAEDGWTVVTHHKGRKKTTDAESGITVGSVAQLVVEDMLAKKKSKEVGPDFYRFQRKEAQRNEIMMLQSKFEQDKKRIQQLRAARKFRPY